MVVKDWEKIDKISDFLMVFLILWTVLDIGFSIYKNKDVLWKMMKKAIKN